MNRIAVAIANKAKDIEARVADGRTTREKLDQASETLNLEFDEYVKFQELKSLAVAEGKLTEEEGQTVYAALGTVPATFNKQPIHVKAVLTGLFRELLGARIAGYR